MQIRQLSTKIDEKPLEIFPIYWKNDITLDIKFQTLQPVTDYYLVFRAYSEEYEIKKSSQNSSEINIKSANPFNAQIFISRADLSNFNLLLDNRLSYEINFIYGTTRQVQTIKTGILVVRSSDQLGIDPADYTGSVTSDGTYRVRVTQQFPDTDDTATGSLNRPDTTNGGNNIFYASLSITLPDIDDVATGTLIAGVPVNLFSVTLALTLPDTEDVATGTITF